MKNYPSDREPEVERQIIPSWLKEVVGIGLLSLIVGGGFASFIKMTDGMVIQEGGKNNSGTLDKKTEREIKTTEREADLEESVESISQILDDIFIFSDQVTEQRILQLSDGYVLYFGLGNNDEHGSVLSLRFNPDDHKSSPVSIRKDGSVSHDIYKVTVSADLKKYAGHTERHFSYSLFSQQHSNNTSETAVHYTPSRVEQKLREALVKFKAGDFGIIRDDFTLSKSSPLENQGSVDKDDLKNIHILGADGKPIPLKIKDE